jgi:hypothetical protein
VVDWLSTSPTKFVSLSAEFDQWTDPEVKTIPDIPLFIGKLMKVFEYSFLNDSYFSAGVCGICAARFAC